MTEILRQQNERTFLAKFLPASLLGVTAYTCQGTLVGISEIIRTQIWTQNK
jgi:hypothetical protein